MIQIRVSSEEKAQMEKHAEACGLKLSEWLRGIALVPEARVPVIGRSVEEVTEKRDAVREEMATAGRDEPVDTRPFFRCPDGHDHVARVPNVRCKHCYTKLVAT